MNIDAHLHLWRLARGDYGWLTPALAPIYREIVVDAELVCRDDADLAVAKRAAAAAITDYFHPLRGGDDGTGWPFGGDIFHSLVQQRLMVAGVRRVARLALTLAGETAPVCTDVPLDGIALLRNGAHQISVRYEESA